MKKKKSFTKKIIGAAIIGLFLGAITPLITATTNASASVSFESTLNVANVTAGDTVYKPSVNAKVDDVVKLELFYHNTEPENSGILAKNVLIKISVPSDFSKSHVFTSNVSGSNINTFVRSATVNTEIDTNISYIPGSAFRRHDIGTNANPNWVTEKIPDSVVGSGFTIPEMKPCFNFQETITILARVQRPVVSIVKKVRLDEESTFKTEMDADPGDTLEYSIGFKNEGNVMLNDVVIRDSLPPTLEYIVGSARLFNSLHPNGITISDKIIDSGVIVGNYGPGINGIVRLKARIPKDIEGCHEFVNVGVVKSKELAEFYNTAEVDACEVEEEKPVEKKFVIKAIKFKDEDEDKQFDDDEDLLPGWTIKLEGNGIEEEAVTNDDGEVVFDDLEDGTYQVTEILKAGWENITPLSQEVNIPENSEKTEFIVCFGNMPIPKEVIPVVKEVEEVEKVEQVVEKEELPVTGPVEGIAGIFGGLSIAGAGVYYKKGRNLLKSAKRKIK